MQGKPKLFGITIHAPDVDEAAVFYRDVVGLELVEERHGEGPKHFHAGWGFPDDGLMFTLWPGEPIRQHLAFLVDDLEAVHERAVAHGVEVIQTPGRHDTASPPDWRDCTLRDPIGNAVHVWQGAAS
jgi:catechol 2,3-dioxygenase-like lactoylglutathione lyase family enzyme